jgi:hypothetical protein
MPLLYEQLYAHFIIFFTSICAILAIHTSIGCSVTFSFFQGLSQGYVNDYETYGHQGKKNSRIVKGFLLK